MKSALLGHNNDSLPRGNFIPPEHASQLERKFLINQQKDGPHYTKEFDMIQNNNILVFCEESSCQVKEHYCKYILSFYKLGRNKIDLQYRKKFNFTSKNPFRYKFDKMCCFVLLAVMDNSKTAISLSFCEIDEVKDLTEAKQSPMPRILNMTIEMGHRMAWITDFSIELSKDERKLCIMIEGGTGAQYFCDAHFFECSFSPENGVSLVKMFSFDASLIGVNTVENTVFNIKGDKIVMLTNKGFLIYSLVNQMVLVEQSIVDYYGFHEFAWSYDLEKGEILVDFDYDEKEIIVYGFKFALKTSSLLNTIQLSTFIPDLSEEDEWNMSMRVSSGTSLVMFGDVDVYLIDPFTGQLVQQVKSDCIDDMVCNVFLDWCSNEILITYFGNNNTQFGRVCKLKTGRVESLLH